MAFTYFYQLNEGQDEWVIRFDDKTTEIFSTEAAMMTRIKQLQQEESMANKKSTFASAVVAATTSLAGVVDDFENLGDVYLDRGYNSGGGNEIVADDLVELGISLADFTAALTMAAQLLKFANNQAVTTADYSVTMNKLRTDI